MLLLGRPVKVYLASNPLCEGVEGVVVWEYPSGQILLNCKGKRKRLDWLILEDKSSGKLIHKANTYMGSLKSEKNFVYSRFDE